MWRGVSTVDDHAVTDTGPPLHLAEIGQEGQLGLFARVLISEQVKAELAWHCVFECIAGALGDRLVVESVSSQELAEQEAAFRGFRLHQADLSTAALAARRQPDVVLTDDLNLRKGLEAHGWLAVGSVGVLVRAFSAGRLTKQELGALLDRLFDDSSLYLSKGFRVHVRRLLDTLTE